MNSVRERKSEIIDYRTYELNSQEKIKYVILASVFLFAVGIIFFSNFILGLVLASSSVYYPKYKVRELIKKRKQELNLQFRDALYSLSSALNAGVSLENSFRAALKDLRVIYHDEDTYILKELLLICRRLEINDSIESCLIDLAERSGLEDIHNFAETIVICKRCGGSLVEVIKNSSNIIREKIDICHEIELSITKQKFEHKLLNIMPVVFIGLMKFGGSGYMDPLYSSVKGYLIMAAALMIIAGAWVISQKILDIRV